MVKRVRKLKSISESAATVLVLAMTMYVFSASPLCAYMERAARERLDAGRMKNVTVIAPGDDSPAATEAAPVTLAAAPEASAAPAAYAADVTADITITAPTPTPISAPELDAAGEGDTVILETTIEGGLTIKNQTGYKADIGSLLVGGPGLTLAAEGPQVLIIHTHSSEAYTQSGLDKYEESDAGRTEDTRYNIVRVGDELAAVFEQAGLRVIHDRGIYDYPSYTGSYTRSGQAVADWLRDYPSIGIVIDVHRDALGSNGTVYKTMAEEEGVCASQAMLLIGTDESGLAHGAWRENLALAVYLQQAVSAAHPTLMRPVQLVPQRYNQHLSTGSMILEVGSSGNTLQEALAAVRLFGVSAGAALAALAQSPETLAAQQ